MFARLQLERSDDSISMCVTDKELSVVYTYILAYVVLTSFINAQVTSTSLVFHSGYTMKSAKLVLCVNLAICLFSVYTAGWYYIYIFYIYKLLLFQQNIAHHLI